MAFTLLRGIDKPWKALLARDTCIRSTGGRTRISAHDMMVVLYY